MAVSVDVARQLWRGQTRMTSVLYRSRLDDGAEVLLHRRQDSECSLAYFYIAATLMLKKMKRHLPAHTFGTINLRTALSDPSAVVNRAFRRIAFPKETDR